MIQMSCPQWRRVLKKHGTVNNLARVAASAPLIGRFEWVTEQCGRPLLSETQRARGICDACFNGWTHEYNHPVEVPTRSSED